MRKIRMFESPTTLPTPRSSLVAVSTKYGLMFVGCPTGIYTVSEHDEWRPAKSGGGGEKGGRRVSSPLKTFGVPHLISFSDIQSTAIHVLSTTYTDTALGACTVPALADSCYEERL